MNAPFNKSADLFLKYVDLKSRLSQEVPFLSNTFGAYQCKNLIEFGCGAGAHSAALAKAGFMIMATDYSDRLIQEAKTYTNESMQVEKADLCQLPELIQKQKYDGAYCIGNTLLLLPDSSMLKKALTNIHSILKPGFPFIAHFINTDLCSEEKNRFGPIRSFPHEDGGELMLVKSFFPEYSEHHPGVSLMAIHRKESGESVVLEHHQNHFLDISPQDFSQMAKDVGFKNIKLLKNFSTDTFDPEKDISLTMVLEA
ncbi:MAG: class I SAM-dependent methyltransferase [Planctomycetes bacterium]|nr:class I SAM-dependent methyltransferase [Planctomycetota bacterium]